MWVWFSELNSDDYLEESRFLKRFGENGDRRPYFPLPQKETTAAQNATFGDAIRFSCKGHQYANLRQFVVDF